MYRSQSRGRLQPGSVAPAFTARAVVGGEIVELSLSDYAGQYVVLFFYPADFTFVCPTEIISFSDRIEEFRSINCAVLACSTDSEFSHFAWSGTARKKGGVGPLDIPLVADKTGSISRNYGVMKEDEGVAFRLAHEFNLGLGDIEDCASGTHNF